jgi:hypothetical protein
MSHLILKGGGVGWLGFGLDQQGFNWIAFEV